MLRRTLDSGNSFGATIYSDGKVFAPQCLEFPLITICSKCSQIFWLNDESYTGIESRYFIEEHEGTAVEDSRFLTFNEYVHAAEAKIYKTIDQEIFIRQHIWWEFNHRKSTGLSFFKSDSEELLWRANINRLLELFDPSDVYQRILIAELNRHLGNFEECLEIIVKLDDNPQWARYKAYYSEDCKNKSTKVFVLSALFNPRD